MRLLISSVAVLAFVANAKAQIAFQAPVTKPDPQPTYFGGPDTSTAGSIDNGDSGSEVLHLTMDWNWQQTPGAAESTATDRASLLFSVGPLPVRVSDLQFTADAKWVNGGGTANDPVTTWTLGSEIDQTTVPYSRTGPVILATPLYSGSMEGNNLTIVNAATDNPGPYILASGVEYALNIVVSTAVDPSGLTADDPTSVVTLEGGAYTDWPGFQASFDWMTVPEPTSLCLLLPAGIYLLGRRRKPVVV